MRSSSFLFCLLWGRADTAENSQLKSSNLSSAYRKHENGVFPEQCVKGV